MGQLLWTRRHCGPMKGDKNGLANHQYKAWESKALTILSTTFNSLTEQIKQNKKNRRGK